MVSDFHIDPFRAGFTFVLGEDSMFQFSAWHLSLSDLYHNAPHWSTNKFSFNGSYKILNVIIY